VTPANPSARDGRNRRLELEYDYMGRRIRKVAYAWDDVAEDWETAPDMDLRFVYDGWNLVQEIDGLVEVESGVTDVSREYTWGLDLSGQSGNPSPAGIHGAGGIGGLLATHWTSNTTSTSDDKAYIYFYDANGNVGQMIESTGSGAGTVAAKYEYYPFGGLLAIDGVAAEANPFRFSTKYRDNETGCYYYGYRYLRTKHGRWLSKDPIGERGGLNSYAYVTNGPPNQYDLLGLTSYPRISGRLKTLCEKECKCRCPCPKTFPTSEARSNDFDPEKGPYDEDCRKKCKSACDKEVDAIIKEIELMKKTLAEQEKKNTTTLVPNCRISPFRLDFQVNLRNKLTYLSCSPVALTKVASKVSPSGCGHTVYGCRPASCKVRKEPVNADGETPEHWDVYVDITYWNNNQVGKIMDYCFDDQKGQIVPRIDGHRNCKHESFGVCTEPSEDHKSRPCMDDWWFGCEFPGRPGHGGCGINDRPGK